MLQCSDLLQTARRLEAAGFTMIGSRYKLPNLHKWKDPTKEQLFEWCLFDLQTGRANSLTVRMDGDLAALDLDFYEDEATPVFVDFWKNFIGTVPVTVRGKKGGKVFFRLQGKAGTQSTLKLFEQQRPGYAPDDWRGNAIELKRDVSAVCGRHSEGVQYSSIEGTKPFADCVPDDLPLCSQDEIEELCNKFVSRRGWLRYSPTKRDEEAARLCTAAVVGVCGVVFPNKLLEEFLKETGHWYELETLRALPHNFIPQQEAALLPKKETALKRLNLIYSKERTELLTEWRASGCDAFCRSLDCDIKAKQLNFLQLFSYIRLYRGWHDPGTGNHKRTQ